MFGSINLPPYIIRLILPVSHFSVKRLIHACVWHCLCSACGRLIKTEIIYPQKKTDNYANCVANTWQWTTFAPIIWKAPNLIVYRVPRLLSIEDESLIYQLWTVVYWTTVALTDNGELGFGSGENAWETAFTAKVGSRSENFSNRQCLKRWLSVSTTAISNWLEWKTIRIGLE